MQVISYIICDSGDGSNHIEWFNHPLAEEDILLLEGYGLDTYLSGDGVQYHEMYFPDEFSIQDWASMNFIQFTDFDKHISEFEMLRE